MLQWVHGPITVVMAGDYNDLLAVSMASMGPRSDNRGYVEAVRIPRRIEVRFNGSTV